MLTHKAMPRLALKLPLDGSAALVQWRPRLHIHHPYTRVCQCAACRACFRRTDSSTSCSIGLRLSSRMRGRASKAAHFRLAESPRLQVCFFGKQTITHHLPSAIVL